MTWSYTSPTTSDKDAVRFLIGDTDTNDQQVTDEEITYLLTLTDQVFLAASMAARTIASKYSRDTGISIESIKSFDADKYKHYMDLAESLARQAKSVGSTGLGHPVITGISLSGILAAESDTDRVKSAFKKGMFDNPQYSTQDDPFAE